MYLSFLLSSCLFETTESISLRVAIQPVSTYAIYFPVQLVCLCTCLVFGCFSTLVTSWHLAPPEMPDRMPYPPTPADARGSAQGKKSLCQIKSQNICSGRIRMPYMWDRMSVCPNMCGSWSNFFQPETAIHSSRNKTVLPRNSRELHVIFLRDPCGATMPLNIS